MTSRLSLLTRVFLLAVMALPMPATALTMTQFQAICESRQAACGEHPILQAYVGGALDLIAALDEDTEYLDPVYCKDPADLFDVQAIIAFMERHGEAYRERNAMLLVIRYLEENGGCSGP